VYLAQTVAWTATTSDGDLDDMKLVLDPGGGETVLDTDVTAPYGGNWSVGTDTGLLGAHTLVARATRGAISTDSDPVAITVDEWALSWVALSKVLQYVRADLGITKDGSNRVSAWADQGAGAKHYTQGTGANQPLYLATGGPNSKPAVQIDSIARTLVSSLDLPAPGTTPTFIWSILRQDAWLSGYYIFTGGGTNHMNVWQAGATPGIRQFNTAHANSVSATIAAWGRLESYFSNTTSDYQKWISTTATGTSAGNTDPDANRSIGSGGGVGNAQVSVVEVLYLNAGASAGEKTNLDAYVTRRYGAGLV